MTTYNLYDKVKMKKAHPCGSSDFTIVRTGADIKIKCDKCGRVVMLSVPDFLKRLKSVKNAVKRSERAYKQRNLH